MSVRQALLQAAQHIRNDPYCFNFSCVVIPWDADNHIGCAIGWVLHFAGQRKRFFNGFIFDPPLRKFMGVSQETFFRRMDEVGLSGGGTDWRSNAQSCASCLERYADRYHPTEPLSVPVWAQMRDREEGNGIAAFHRFRQALVLSPRTILPAQVSEEVSA